MEVVKGLDIKRTAQGIAVARLHYTADPDKDPDTDKGRLWLNDAISMYPGGMNSLLWRREMEIDWSAGSGELVFDYFSEKEREIVIDPTVFNERFLANCKFYGGMDWGRRNPACFHVYVEDSNGYFYSIWEYYDVGKNVTQVAEVIRACPYYERLEWIAADPSMWTETQAKANGFTSLARIFQEDLPDELRLGKLMPAHARGDMMGVERFHNMFACTPPKFRISKLCRKQIQEFRNLKYAPKLYDKNEPEKLLDKDNHAFDSAKYFLLSHPTAKILVERPKFGTLGHLNEKAEIARQIALETGGDPQEIFNDIYGE